MYAAPEQQPIPCQRCGAAMAPTHEGPLYNDVIALGCLYCGARETVRHDDRLRVSRERIALLRMAQDAAEAPALHADRLIASRPWLGGVVVGAVMLLNGLNQLGATRDALDRAGVDTAQRTELLVPACLWPTVGVGVVAGMFVGWTLALRQYRAAVTPVRRARPPRTPHGAARCRCCGADLPGQWGAFVVCAYCNTHNLLDRSLLAARESLLVEETRVQQARAAGVIARANALTPTFGRWSMVGAALGAGLGAALGYALASALA